MKSEIDKLQLFYELAEKDSHTETETPLPEQQEIKQVPIELPNNSDLNKEPSNAPQQPRKSLIEDSNKEMFKSIQKSKTSLLVMTNAKRAEEEETGSDVQVKSVNELAQIIVEKVVVQAVGDLTAGSQSNDDMNNYRHSMSAKSYYKDYQATDEEPIDTQDEESDEKLLLDFEDEPLEAAESDLFAFRQSKIEEFKLFLKENNAFLFYKLWMDIEKLDMMSEKTDKFM